MYNNRMESKIFISKALIRHRIFPNRKGYKYLLKVLEYVLGNGKSTMFDAYESVASRYGVKVNSVEKCIANAIENSFNSIYIAETYGNIASADSGKITNKKFIKLLVDEIHNAV